jgi:hypothetical protein
MSIPPRKGDSWGPRPIDPLENFIIAGLILLAIVGIIGLIMWLA